MTWWAVGITAVSVAMQIGGKVSGNKGLQYGGMGVGALGGIGGAMGAFGGAAGAAGGAAGSAGGSGGGFLGGLGSLFSAGGAAEAGTGATSAVPSLLNGAMLSDIAAQTPELGSMAGAFGPSMGAPFEAVSASPSIAPGAMAGFNPQPLSFDPGSMASLDKFTYDPMNSGIMGSSIGSGVPSDPNIDPLTGKAKSPQATSPWVTAAKASGDVIGTVLASRQQQQPLVQPAPVPRLSSDARGVPVKVGEPMKKPLSPLDKFALYMRSF